MEMMRSSSLPSLTPAIIPKTSARGMMNTKASPARDYGVFSRAGPGELLTGRLYCRE